MTHDQPTPLSHESSRTPRVRVRVLTVGVLVGALLSFVIAFFRFVRNPEFQKIRAAWVAERPLVEQLQNRGAKFNESIWWTPENGESFLFACAYKHYRQVQHIRFTKPDLSGVSFSRLNEFEHLDSIDLSDTNIRADQLAQMRNKGWVRIDLCRTEVTTECLSNLVTTNRLTYLSLAGSTVKDDMLAPLTNSMIGVFSIENTQITDAGMTTVAQMHYVHSLNLARTKIGDEGLRMLAQINLTDLNLAETAITDAGLTNLLMSNPWRNLTLNLSNTRVSDAGMTVFKQFKSIQALNLANTQVSDAGLESLREQRYLRWLCVGGTKVTSAGVEALLKTRKEQKAEWKARGPRNTVEPYDLILLMDKTRTERPRAYPE